MYSIIPRDATHIEQTKSAFILGDGLKKSAEKMNRVKRRSPLIYYFMGHSWILGLRNNHEASLQNIFTLHRASSRPTKNTVLRLSIEICIFPGN